MLLLLFSGASSDTPVVTAPINRTAGERDLALSLPDKSQSLQLPATQPARGTNLNLTGER